MKNIVIAILATTLVTGCLFSKKEEAPTEQPPAATEPAPAEPVPAEPAPAE